METESNLPVGTVGWRELQEDPDSWIILETTELFIARKAADTTGAYLVEFSELEGLEANRWLRWMAAADREDYCPCNCCGHVIHRKLPTFPFCGTGCRDHQP